MADRQTCYWYWLAVFRCRVCRVGPDWQTIRGCWAVCPVNHGSVYVDRMIQTEEQTSSTTETSENAADSRSDHNLPQPAADTPRPTLTLNANAVLDWIEQCFTSPPTQYRLYGRRFLQVKRPNQQYRSTEGKSPKEKSNNVNNKIHICIHNNKTKKDTTHITHNKLPSLHWYGVTRGQLPQTAGSPGLNGDGTSAAVPPR